MIIVKLVVLFVYVKSFSACSVDYCEICPNHTLCKYITPGPSPICKAYDKSALLTNDDIIDIVSRINDRRNFVAMGNSKTLPQAANMNKVRWSEELATFAQRWADQCDESLTPDKEDQCRDLATVNVGQSIATISGPAPGLHVKSFVEIWFMQTLDYTGSISYYNISRDNITNHFTQLIWADTELVGCGKAKFYVFPKNNMIERIVCNFAPKGNIHGKPVYLIGLPATQCPQNTISDDKFPGLCNYQNHENVRKFTSQRPLVSSLLRILNLSNNSVKQEIDPIRNNLKQIYLNSNNTSDQRNQKTRHVFLDNSHGAMKRVPPTQGPNFWNKQSNNSRKFGNNHFQRERGHSRVYHGYDNQRNNFASTHNDNTEQNYRRYDYTTESLSSYSNKEFRNNYPSEQCTRKVHAIDFCTPSGCKNYQCTRGQNKECYQQTVKCFHPVSLKPEPCLNPTSRHVYPDDLCPCNNPTTPRSTHLPCNYNFKCAQLSTSCSHKNCRKAMENQDDFMKDKIKKPTEFHYYDLFPNIGIRSGDEKGLHDDSIISHDTNTEKPLKKLHDNGHILSDRNLKQVKAVIDYTKSNDEDRDYLYGSFAYSEKKKREVEDQIHTLKPFWQMDEFSHIKPTQLKAIRYTTLTNKRNRKTKRTSVATTKRSISMESITITAKESLLTSNNHRDKIIINHPTEKYLSFEELMHLRKLTTTKELDYDARRQANSQAASDATTKAASTSEITANTPFMRKKHCTRKLTCTWTGSTITGQDGNVILPGGGGDRGSRTPPGYVDGCTRTSTCTREFMNRNRISTASDSSSQPTLEDEDYCERRSLNVKRRNSDKQAVTEVDIGHQEAYVNTPQSTSYIFVETVTKSDKDSTTKGQITTAESEKNCICYYNNARIKRDKSNNRLVDDDIIKTKYSNKPVSYVEVYYLILRNIIKSWEKHRYSYQSRKCLCNCSLEKSNCLVLKSFSLFCIILLH